MSFPQEIKCWTLTFSTTTITRRPTFNVTFVSDCLQRGTTGEELLQLVSGLFVFCGVHAGGGLHGCGDGGERERTVITMATNLCRHKHTHTHTLTSGPLGVSVLLLLVVTLWSRRFWQIFFYGLVRLPGLRQTPVRHQQL